MSGDTIPGRFIHWHRKFTTGFTEMFRVLSSKPSTAHLKERGFEQGTTVLPENISLHLSPCDIIIF